MCVIGMMRRRNGYWNDDTVEFFPLSGLARPMYCRLCAWTTCHADCRLHLILETETDVVLDHQQNLPVVAYVHLYTPNNMHAASF